MTYTKVCVQQCVNRDDASLIISSTVSSQMAVQRMSNSRRTPKNDEKKGLEIKRNQSYSSSYRESVAPRSGVDERQCSRTTSSSASSTMDCVGPRRDE